jgi:hypothetical protein
MNTNNKNNNNNNNNKNNNKRRKRRRVRMPNRVRRTLKQIRRMRMPVAQTISVPKIFYNRRITGTSATVAGCDLVYQIPDSLSTNSTSSVITIIPANPAYWTGTRIAQVAAGYQNYRPLQFEVIYVPQCAVTQQGNVLGGTLWNEAPTENNLQQTLKTSNGGMLTQCYKTATSIVRMKSNLQYNLFRMGGAIDQESNPFIFIALAIACRDSNNNRIVPGYFYIRYTYQLKNPIGTGINYQNSQLTTRITKTTYLMNSSIYLCSPITTVNGLQIPTGSRLNVEYNNNNNQPKYEYDYNGTPVDPITITNIWVLENQPNVPSNLSSLRVLKEPTTINFEDAEVTTQPEQTITIPIGEAITFRNVEDDFYTTILNNSKIPFDYTIFSPGTTVYKIADLLQNFGTLENIAPAGWQQYAINAAWTLLKQSLTRKKQTQELQESMEKLDIKTDQK